MTNKNSNRLKVEGDAESILALAYGGKVPQKLAAGGVAEGPDHEDGGIPVEQAGTGEQVAEIEGGERVFSQEDTAALEEAAMQIVEAQQAGDQQTSDQMAMQLGYAVVNMIAAQEQAQGEQEQAAGQPQVDPNAQAAAEAEAMNSFENTPQEYQTMQ